MTEDEAINFVLGGGHPGSCISGARVFSPEPGDEEFEFFIAEDIPEEWTRFRTLCHYWWKR